MTLLLFASCIQTFDTWPSCQQLVGLLELRLWALVVRASGNCMAMYTLTPWLITLNECFYPFVITAETAQMGKGVVHPLLMSFYIFVHHS